MSSRTIISSLLPNINLRKFSSMYKPEYSMLQYNPEDIEVNIICGEVISGILDKSTAGDSAAGGIFHIIANEYGNDRSLETIFNLQQVTHKFLMYHGFTSGIADINISEKAIREIKEKVAGLIADSRLITEKLNNGKLIAPLGMSLKDYYEAEQINALSTGDDFVIPIFNDIKLETNMTARMIMMGSKGKLPNFISINGAIGGQYINNKRFGYNAGWGRTSPYFPRYSTEPAANGYIAQSFREGIKNDVWTFCAAETRYGQIANALSTSVTGSQSRVSIKNLESCIIDNLRKTVKNMNVVQVLYAECGIDSAKTEKVKFPTILMSKQDFVEKYKMTVEKYKKITNSNHSANSNLEKLFNDEFKILEEDREHFRKIFLKMEMENPQEYVMDNVKHMPVNIPRIIEDTLYNLKKSKEKHKDIINTEPIDLAYLIETVRNLCNNLPYCYSNEMREKAKSPIPYQYVVACFLMNIQIRSYLCSANVIKTEMTNAALDIIVDRIRFIFKRSLIDYGTSVGIIAAQCASEILTQYVLNSKHRTGGIGGTKTDAIVRSQEIFGAKGTDSMKNPHMLVMVKPEYADNKIKVKEIADHIEMMNFDKFITRTCVFHEEFGKPLHPEFTSEADFIVKFAQSRQSFKKPAELAKWCIRYEINKEELILKSMRLETIVMALYKTCPELYLCYTPENAKVIYIRCYLRNSKFKQTNTYYETNIVPLLEKMRNIIVRGVDKIIRTNVIEVIKTFKQPDESLITRKTYAIYCTGSNLEEILLNPYIDPYNTHSDSVRETERVFGVMAARNKIVNELLATLDGTTRFHFTVFADEMTYSGSVTSIQKTGLQKRENANISLLLAFQMPVQVVQGAAIDGLSDKISGISGPLIMGTNPNVGTNYNQIIIDREFVSNNTKSIEDELNDL